MRKFLSVLLFICIIIINFSVYAESFVMHTVKSGDTYFNISNQYNVDINKLQKLNNDFGDMLNIGSLVKISPLSNNKDITIRANGNIVTPDQYPYIENSRTFVPIRFIAEALNVKQIIWDGDNKTAILKNEDKTISLPIGSEVAFINDEAVKLDAPINAYKGRTFVPLRFVAEAFECIVDWDNETYSVDIYDKYTSADLVWLSRIVHAESEGEPYEGKLAVANVIINRKNDNSYPNTIKEVVFDNKYGVQFTPTINGKIYNNPSSESIIAAKAALEGENNVEDCLYFLNPNIAISSWISNNRTFFSQIANHVFYK